MPPPLELCPVHLGHGHQQAQTRWGTVEGGIGEAGDRHLSIYRPAIPTAACAQRSVEASFPLEINVWDYLWLLVFW